MDIFVLGKKIHYTRIGEGRTVLFVHGYGGSSASLSGVARILSDSFDCICIDLPGFGRSDNPDPQWGIPEYAHLVSEFIRELRLNDVVYVGHSFGGSLGIYIMSLGNPLIANLVLCDTSFKREVVKSRISRFKQFIPAFLREQRLLKRLIYRICLPNSDIGKYMHLEQNFRRIIQQDLTDRLSLISCPTLLLWGREDSVTPLTFAAILHKNIKGSHLEICDSAGHGLPLRNPQWVAEHIIRFVR